jgi:hypothetical protein
MMGADGRITAHGSPVRRKDREMYKTEVKPCRTKKLSKEELDNELRKIGVEGKPMMQNILIKEDLERLLDEGLSCDEIVNVTGLSKSCVVQKAKRYGLEVSMRMNEKPKQEDTVPAVTSKQKRAGGEEMAKTKQDIEEPAQKPVSEAQESETGKCAEKKPCKISLDDIIDDVAQDLEDLKTTKMVLRKLADGAGSVEISL